MIIQRQSQLENKSVMHKFHDSGMEFKPIYKKHNMSRDNDDLLKPIPRPKHVEEMHSQENQSLKERTERNLWRNEEVMEMLYTMQQVKALEKLNDKSVKSENVFKDVEVIMHRNGFVKKSHVQIWTKWKFLKSTYMTSRRNGVIPRIIAPQIYEIIHQMITNLNQSMADSCSSLDGDNSSVSGMLISGVEGDINNEVEEEDRFGMAHPIFGFRLGMVKPEPEDTGYEPNDNNDSDKDPLEEELPTKTSGKEVKEGQNGVGKFNKEAQPDQKVIEIPHRGRGRPPKNPPAATSTPNNTPSPAAMPPLRVAPFAKGNIFANKNAANRPPPPLTMPPTPRIRVANFSNLQDSSSLKFTQPKLIPKPMQQQHSPPQTAVRINKETTAQTRSSSTPSPSYPKMKQIPMRKTPYSLRPDRAIPDLESSLSPPPPALERFSSKKLEEVPSTKHLVMHSNSNNLQNANNRKRRNDWSDQMTNKQPKFDDSQEEEKDNSKSFNIEYDKNYGKVLQNVIIDLSSSLRKMQTEMMRDFFNKQNDLLEREHKFQMHQDDMIMKAFQEQTQEIMQSVKHLVGSIKNQKNCQQTEQKEYKRQANHNEKVRMRHMHARKGENKLEAGEESEMQIEVEQGQSREGDNGIENDMEDMYTDDEQQQDQMEEQDGTMEEEMENNADEEEDENDNNEEQEDEQDSQLMEAQNANKCLSKNEHRNPKRGNSKQFNED